MYYHNTTRKNFYVKSKDDTWKTYYNKRLFTILFIIFKSFLQGT